MNVYLLNAGALLLLVAVVLGSEEASPQPDACSATENVVVEEILVKLGEFFQSQDLSFEDLVGRIFSNCDSNEDSFIDLGELLACINSSDIGEKFQEAVAAVSKPCSEHVLHSFDINGDGGLGARELRLILTSLGVK